MSKQEVELTGYCGLYCGDCIRYRSRAADLAEELLDELRKQTGAGEYLFPDDHAVFLKDASATSKQFQKFLEDCGIQTTEPRGAHRRKVIVRKGFHSLRHSFVSLCAANRVPQHVIQELVGHGSPAMTALYSHADFQQKQDAINGLPAMAFDEQKPDTTSTPARKEPK